MFLISFFKDFKLCTNHKKNALSILELSIGLVILGVIMVPAINLTGVAIERGKAEKTRTRIENVKNALDNFFYINKRLPCPAVRTLGEADAGYATSQSTCTTNSVAIGAVPVDTLGLSREHMFDAYGRKLTYAMSSVASVSGGAKFLKTGSTIILDDGTGTAIPNTKKITINSGSGGTITNDAAFVVLSHGKDGLGAVQKTGELSALPDSSSSDYLNAIENTLIFVDISNGNANGDDIISYSTFTGYIPKLIEYGYIDCVPTNIVNNNPVASTTYVFPRTNGGTVSFPSTISCPSDKPNITDLAAMYCSKTGEWIGFRPQICTGTTKVAGVRLNNNNTENFLADSGGTISISPVIRKINVSTTSGTLTATPNTSGIINVTTTGSLTMSYNSATNTITINSPTFQVNGTNVAPGSNVVSITAIKDIIYGGSTYTPTNGTITLNMPPPPPSTSNNVVYVLKNGSWVQYP